MQKVPQIFDFTTENAAENPPFPRGICRGILNYWPRFPKGTVHSSVCVYVCVGYLLAKVFGSWTSFGSTIQCVVTIIAFMAEVVGMSVGSGFSVLSSRGWLVK